MSYTEKMCIGGEEQDIVLEDGRTIQCCSEYKYFGLKLTGDGTLDEAIKERNVKGRKSISIMNSILWDQNISKDNKQRIHNSIVKNIIIYGSEVWQMKDRTENFLKATEMDFWRRAAGRSRREKVTNEIIREIMGVKHTIMDDIKTKQLMWYGHVQRMEEGRLPKIILKWSPTGRRRRGRSKRSWREGVEKEMRLRELEDDLWADTDRWRLGVGARYIPMMTTSYRSYKI